MRVTQWLRGLIPALALAAPLSAQAQGELVVYCTVQEEWCRPMVEAFQKTTGIRVLMTRKSSGEFYAQIKAEAANPRGDIWWGGTGDPHLQAAEEGLTEPYKSPRMAELRERIFTLMQRDNRDGTRLAAAAAMGRIGTAEDVARLKKSIRHETSGKVRQRIERSVRQISAGQSAESGG